MSSIQDLGVISKNNSTNTQLAGGATFTGREEDCSAFSTITTFTYSDVASANNGVIIEFSMDGTNWDRAKTTSLKAGLSQVHSLATISQFYRVRYINGSATTAEFRIQTILHANKPRDISSGTEQVLQTYDDVTLFRPVSDVTFDRNVGRVGYESVGAIHGVSTGVSTSAVSLWEYSATGNFPFPTVAETLRVKAGGNAADTSAGLGARTITIIGLDENFDEVTETLTLAGTSASSATSATFIRVNFMVVTTVGAYGVRNTGNIILENTSTNAVIGFIPADIGEMHAARFTVPAGKTGYITKEVHEVSVGNTATLKVFTRANADDIVAPFSPALVHEEILDFEGEFLDPHDSYLILTEKSDIYVEAIKVSGGGTASVSSEIDYILVDNPLV